MLTNREAWCAWIVCFERHMLVKRLELIGSYRQKYLSVIFYRCIHWKKAFGISDRYICKKLSMVSFRWIYLSKIIDGHKIPSIGISYKHFTEEFWSVRNIKLLSDFGGYQWIYVVKNIIFCSECESLILTVNLIE